MVVGTSVFGSESLKPKNRWDFSAGENEGDKSNKQEYKETRREWERERECESACVSDDNFSGLVKLLTQ